MVTHHISYKDTGYFSPLVLDYLSAQPAIRSWYNAAPTTEGMQQAIAERAQHPVNRQILFDTLTAQYSTLTPHEKVTHNLSLLLQPNTFTICTAHQPNLLTGYLYFIYKIIHAIKLAHNLQVLYPANNFVPVYYMGSEDNDLEELGTFRYEGKKFVWDAAGQTGAVGRMTTESLKPLLAELFAIMGPPGNYCDELKDLLTKAYLQHTDIAQATQYLVNEFFGRFGLIVLNPDEAAFKQAIIPVMQDDLLHHTAYHIVSQRSEEIAAHYKVQAHPRLINLFYLHGNIRERIERVGDTWQVLHTDISWTQEQLLAELHAHPERFSPNVILRGIFQESILPNVAFIGGGAEVAYWLQLQSLFAHYDVCYPSIHLRQSVLWIEQRPATLREQLGLSVTDIFRQEADLTRSFVQQHAQHDWQTITEQAETDKLLLSLKAKATALDPTLRASAEAVTTKIRYQLQVLEKKMLRAEKRNMHTQLMKIARIKEELFPNNSLQERYDNFLAYYLSYGPSFFDKLYKSMQPLQHSFMVVENK